MDKTMVSVVTVNRLLVGFIEDDEFKISSYKEFILENFIYDDNVRLLLSAESKSDAIKAGTLIQNNLDKDSRAYRIIHRTLDGSYKNLKSMVTLDTL